jgi:iron complex transport system substrate-binding protein
MKIKYNIYFISLILVIAIIDCQKFQNQKQLEQGIKNYQRIISLSPSTTEILFALGLNDKIIGVTRFCQYPPEANKKMDVGGYLDPNYEAIAMLESDLVVILPEQDKVKDYLDQLGINHITVNNKTIADILNSIKEIGDLVQATAKAESLITEIKGKIDAIASQTKKLQKPKVLICIGRNFGTGNLEDVYFAGRNTFYDELIITAGGINAIDKHVLPILCFLLKA